MAENKPNIFFKIQEMRCELQKMEIKKSGNNKFIGFKYYELSDFLPKVNDLCKKHSVTPIFSTSSEKATLTIVNMENTEEKIEFSTNVKECLMKGALPIQNLGAEITYLRRYLYMFAFEIVEEDVIDGLSNENKEQSQQPSQQNTDNRPWLSEKALQQAMDRIAVGDNEVYQKTIEAFRMKKEYRAKLDEQNIKYVK